MKRLLFTLVLFSAIFIPSAHAVDSLPYFSTLRAQVLSQLNLATNVAEPDKKLVSALNKALATIDKTQPTYAAGAKALGVVAKGVNRSSVSNAFVAVFQSTISDYVSALTGDEATLAGRLAATFPSKSKTSGELALERLLAALQGANATDDIIAAAKLLGTAAKELGTAGKLTVKAEVTPAPPANVTAMVTGASNFKYDSMLAAAVSFSSGSGLINSAQALLKSPYGQRGVLISFIGVNAGPNTLTIGSHNSGLCELLVTEAYGNGFASSYESTGGTINVTYNPATKSLVGTFTATCIDGANTITITGSFSANTL